MASWFVVRQVTRPNGGAIKTTTETRGEMRAAIWFAKVCTALASFAEARATALRRAVTAALLMPHVSLSWKTGSDSSVAGDSAAMEGALWYLP